ncbi:MAG: dihydroxyacetone kinase subunit DhaL [Anaerolineales bacterium]
MTDTALITKGDLVEILRLLAKTFEEHVDHLSKLDTEIGDGDHGFSMASGFKSVADKLDQLSELPIGDLLKKTGFELIKTIGGAAGAVFGTLFTGQASIYQANPEGKESLTLQQWSEMFTEALAQIQRRGGAQLGDKTMLDALQPAVTALEEAAAQNADLGDAFQTAARRARSGALSTKDMIAKHGRAKNLGERALGFVDPGSVSTALIFETLADYFTNRESSARIDS